MGAIFNDFIDILNGVKPGTTNAGIAAGNAAETEVQTGTNPVTGDTIDNSNQDLLDEGAITQAQYDQTVADYNESQSDDTVDTVENTFNQALSTELQNPIGTLWGEVTSGLKNVLGQIPVSLWLVIAVGVFLWLGGGGFVERRARERLSR